MAQLVLPKGLAPEVVAILDELALEHLRSAAKYSIEHDDELMLRDWDRMISGRTSGAIIAQASQDPISRQLMLEAGAAIVAWILAFDREAHRPFLRAR